MIAVSQPTEDALNKSVNLSLTSGCTIEYNMNDLISGTSVDATAGFVTIPRVDSNGAAFKPFEKLFPITSIIDPRRPKSSGIQYVILGDPSTKYEDTSVYSSAKNITGKRLYFSSIKTAYKYWVAQAATGLKTLTNCVLSVKYPAAKKAAANKIVIKFEISHSKPDAFTVSLTPLTGAAYTIYTQTVWPNSNTTGVIELYYNGSTTWTTTPPAVVPDGVDLSQINLGVTAIDTTSGYLGVIEISARLVKDVTGILESINISQNSSDSVNGLVPVGDVTANSLRVNLNAYDKSYENYDKSDAFFKKDKLNLFKNICLRPYAVIGLEKINLGTFYLDTYQVDEFGAVSINALDGARELQYIKPPDIICESMSSVAIMRRLLDSVGVTNYNFNLLTDSTGLIVNDDSIITPQYWFTDPRKTVWQHIQDLCKDTQMIAVFDNNDTLQFYPRGKIFDKTKNPQASFRYAENLLGLSNISSISIENVPSVKAIKVMYSPQLTSNYDRDADNLYTSPVVTLGAGALAETLSYPTLPTFPSSPTLDQDFVSGVNTWRWDGSAWNLKSIPSGDPEAPLGSIKLDMVRISGEAKQLYSFSGYLVLNKEIIEYDAIKYSYRPLGASITVSATKWITSESDVQSSQALAEPKSFKPTKEYRIKRRNAFNIIPASNTTDLNHIVDEAAIKNEWKGYKWDSKTGDIVFTSDTSDELFTIKPIPVERDPITRVVVGENKYKLENSIPRSMLTVFAESFTEVSAPTTENPQAKAVVPNTNYSLVSIDVADFFPKVGATTTIPENFIIGTNMYFPLIQKNGFQTGNQKTISGLAFSLSSNNKSGYLLSIATSQNARSEKNFREINMYKIVNGKLEKMVDSQTENDGTIITNINGGTLYRVDIKSNYSVPKNAPAGTTPVLTMIVSVNNKTFVVSDQSPISITQKIGLVSLQGTSSFDYIYGSTIDVKEFARSESFDPYQGYLGGEGFISKTFGDFVFNQRTKSDSQTWVREFGPVARELRKITSRYRTPGFPKYPKLINNPDVVLAGSSFDAFSMEMYVLNNTGAFTDLANSREKQFIVVGNSIVPSDSFEYMDPDISEADKQEIIGFDSTWIQREDDAKALAKWMSGQWAKQQKVLTLETFINPTIQIGDIIQVSYPDNKIYSEEDTLPVGYAKSKFVVLALDSTYDKDSPPTTSITCRSIYTG